MLMIVLHHYCVNSGLTEVMKWNDITSNMILVQFMSIGGKVGVNGFFLISGYFMIHKLASVQKMIKLIFEVWFYNIVVFLFFLLMGVEYTTSEIVKCFIPILFSFPASFIGNYLLVYILSPMINKGLKALSKKSLMFCWSLCWLSIAYCKHFSYKVHGSISDGDLRCIV